MRATDTSDSAIGDYHLVNDSTNAAAMAGLPLPYTPPVVSVANVGQPCLRQAPDASWRETL